MREYPTGRVSLCSLRAICEITDDVTGDNGMQGQELTVTSVPCVLDDTAPRRLGTADGHVSDMIPTSSSSPSVCVRAIEARSDTKAPGEKNRERDLVYVCVDESMRRR